LSSFADLLEAGFHRDAPPFDPVWPPRYGRENPSLVGYRRWEQTIISQIVDLHEMEQVGTLANDLRYFGIDSPRGSRWYNFDPLAFVECGVAGTFDGWRSGDPTGRDFVPGPVAVLDSSGRATSADPRELEAPLFQIDFLSWDLAADFLRSGQSYE
jgi:hypothetical protein